MSETKSWIDSAGNFYWADEKDPAYIEWAEDAAEREEKEATERKEVLSRFVHSIEGISDEDLHAMFVARAVKKAIWDEKDLRAAIHKADEEMGWLPTIRQDFEDGGFDELFKRIGQES